MDLGRGSPAALAARAAKTMWARDAASQHLGMDLIKTSPGCAEIGLTVSQIHVNGHGMAHGGVLFALADTAFAFACNSDGNTTVASHCSITFLRPAKLGDRLSAMARQIYSNGRSGLYDVQISCGADVIAEFRGHSKATGSSFLPPAD